MKKIILFSEPTTVLDKIEPIIFPKELSHKKLAYIQAAGELSQKYFDYWKSVADRNSTEIIYINNSAQNPDEEKAKMDSCNILMITGGKLIDCANNLKTSGLDSAVLQFLQRDNFIYAGFSAGAMILTPSIRLADFGKSYENSESKTNWQGLNIVDFEIFPHFVPEEDNSALKEYRKSSPNEVRPLTDEEFIVIDL
jgi:peptidase E